MNGKDALKAQYRFLYLTAKANVDGITAEASLKQPSPAGNCPNWILGHLIEAQNAAMRLVGEAPVWDSDALERVVDDPIDSADDALDWDTMVTKLVDSENRFMAALEALSDERLDEEGFTDPFGQETTRGMLLNLLAVHGNYHAGQLGLSRRLVGLEGAIRSPR